MSDLANDVDTDSLPTTGARAWSAEGARVAITTCAICGAALLLDPGDKIDVVELHRLWHRDSNPGEKP